MPLAFKVTVAPTQVPKQAPSVRGVACRVLLQQWHVGLCHVDRHSTFENALSSVARISSLGVGQHSKPELRVLETLPPDIQRVREHSRHRTQTKLRQA
jgi:hypothetical protein